MRESLLTLCVLIVPRAALYRYVAALKLLSVICFVYFYGRTALNE
uniref:Uncharacterized protein n=1 Tax=Anguilla anguilla TaxID=7936 RepID=A0A0E9W2C1_ANGAN